MVKIIQLNYGLGLNDMNGPTKPFDEQVRNIMNENKNYRYVGLINEPSKYSNIQKAALVIETIK